MSSDRISAIGSGPKALPPILDGGFRTAMQQSLALVAAQLGMSVSDLRVNMQFGKTPADVAAERGMSQTALLGVIKESLSGSEIATGAKAVDATASRIANFKNPNQGAADTQPEQAAQSVHDSDRDDIVAR